MFILNSRIIFNSCLFSLGGLALLQNLSPGPAYSQVYLNNNTPRMERSTASLDMSNGIRCSSNGGSVPTMSMSVGALPDNLYDSNIINSDFYSSIPSNLSAMLTVNVPLLQTSQNYSCNELLEQTLVRSKIDNLREMYEEGIITNRQFQSMSLKLNRKLFSSTEYIEAEKSLDFGENATQGRFSLSLGDELPIEGDQKPLLSKGKKSTDLVFQERSELNLQAVQHNPPHLQSPPPLPSISEPVYNKEHRKNIASYW